MSNNTKYTEQINKAKSLDMGSILELIGSSLVRNESTCTLYENPFRGSNNNSFKVFYSSKHNHEVAYDHAEKEIYNNIQLIEKSQGLSFNEAVKMLSTLKGIKQTGFVHKEKQSTASTTNRMIEGNLNIKSKNKAVQYLKTKGLNLELSARFLKSSELRRKNKNSLFGLSFKNESGGHEFIVPMAKVLKMSSGKKDVTIINGTSKHWLVFEGITSYLALCTEKGRESNLNVMILNSVTTVKKAIKHLEEKNKGKVFLYLDNDLAGSKASLELIKALGYDTVVDCRYKYKAFNDYNDKLLNNPITKEDINKWTVGIEKEILISKSIADKTFLEYEKKRIPID